MELIRRRKAEKQVQHLQRKLYRWSKEERYPFGRIYNLIYNPIVLSLAWYLLCENKGSRTAGVDRVTVRTVKTKIGAEKWLTAIEHKLRARTFEPDAVRRKRIAKPGKPGKYRKLGIPTLEDRLVQMAAKLILEPIFEAGFKESSFGFRPSRSTHDALARIRMYMNTRYGYEWVVEADLRSCFDNINHGVLLREIKKTVRDKRVLALVRGFLKAGVMEDGKERLPVSGTPQGGIISPLLANIYLDQLDELFEQHHWLSDDERRKLIEAGQPIFQYIRYADDFVILVKGTRDHAEAALTNLRSFVQETLKMELAEEKTGVRHVSEGFVFLGYEFRRGRSQCAPKPATVMRPSAEAITRLKRKAKELTSKRQTWKPLKTILMELNRVIRGWGQYFQYGSVSMLFSKLDWYINQCVCRWLQKKHKKRTYKWLRRKYYTSDLFGRRHWSAEGVTLRLLNHQFRSTQFRGTSKVLPSPYDPPTYQSTLRDHFPGLGSLYFMERVLQRQRPSREPSDGKLSRWVRKAAGRNVPSGVRAPC